MGLILFGLVPQHGREGRTIVVAPNGMRDMAPNGMRDMAPNGMRDAIQAGVMSMSMDTG